MQNNMKEIELQKIDYEKTADEIGDFIVDQIVTIGFTGGILGVSGGVDSTVVAALTKRAFDKYNLTAEKKLELVGYLMPSKVNDPADLEDGMKVVERLNMRHEIVEIQPMVDTYSIIDKQTAENAYEKGNLMSELRALVLHRKAANEKKLVVGTGNHDEDFGVGYYTLFGDGAVHMSPISALSKRCVREMARFLGFSDLADRVPTAGLEPGQTDFGDLGYSYDFVELISAGKAQGFSEDGLRIHEQVKELFEKEKVDYAKVYGKAKFETLDEALNDLFFRNKIAIAKANIISPPSFEVGEGVK
jgi:NAD+ synthase